MEKKIEGKRDGKEDRGERDGKEDRDWRNKRVLLERS